MNKRYLLDSNILIHLLLNQPAVRSKIEQVGWENCCISEISVVELLYGAQCSTAPEKNRELVKGLLSTIEIIPFGVCIEEFCIQKGRLRQLGLLIEDFDLLIGCTSVAIGCVMVSENIKHLSRIANIELENWVVR